jgi:hypothetical protein
VNVAKNTHLWFFTIHNTTLNVVREIPSKNYYWMINGMIDQFKRQHNNQQ